MAQFVVCEKCKTSFELSDPVIDVVNQISFSMIMINHGAIKNKTCTKCGQEYFLAIKSFDMAAFKIGVFPVPEQKEKPLIVSPPNGFKM